ncbi:MAG: 30S ribosomal protein S3 [Candidatus Magasanikbacteria bacterium]
MGHKVHPQIQRTGVLFPWFSRWVNKQNYALYVQQDVLIREYIMKRFVDAQIDSVFIERGAKQVTITVFSGKPGVIIGRGGQGLDGIRKDIERKFLQMSLRVKLQIQEVSNPSLSSEIVAQAIVKDIENRIPFRRVMKQTIERVMKAGAQGIKIGLSGRLNGVEIARREKLASGKIPLITLRSNVQYAYRVARTIYGAIGVKVWIYHGESFVRVDKLATRGEVKTKK